MKLFSTKKVRFELFTVYIGLLLILTACNHESVEHAASDKYRLVWNTDPETSVTLGWNQIQPSEVEVFFGTKDFGKQYWKYQNKVKPTDGNSKYGMSTKFAMLDKLLPATNYYFVVKDEIGVSDRYWFKTAPAEPTAFTFVAGGDTKSSGLPLEAGRASNKLVGKLRPLFVIFNGDFNSGNGLDSRLWQQWLNDWQKQTTTEDGRMIPIFPVHGNHENGDKGNLNYIFNSPYHNNDSSSIYYSATIGGNLLHLIALNSEIETGGAQKKWLAEDLKNSKDCTFKIAGYHKPFRPHHTGKRENDYQYKQWVWLFDKYGLDISVDADSHMHKITYPVSPDTISGEAEMGFIRNDDNGTMYIGEGSWGASPRKNDDDKSWTLASGSFNQIKWIHVFPDENKTPARMEIYTVKSASYNSEGEQTLYDANVEALTENNLFDIPKNITLFADDNTGNVVIYPFGLNK